MPWRRKSVVFSIAFFLLFSVLLSFAIIASSAERERRATEGRALRVVREGALAETIGRNLASFMNLSIAGERGSDGNLTLNASTSLYSPDPDLSRYSDFISQKFLPKTNINATMDVSEFSLLPRFYSDSANITFGSLSRSSVNFSFPEEIVSGRIYARFSDGSEIDASGWTWQSCDLSCPSGQFFIELDIWNSTGSQILPGGCSYGCLTSASTNILRLNSSSPETASINVSARHFSVSAKESAQLVLSESARLPSDGRASFWAKGSLQISQGRSNFTSFPITKI